MKIFGKTFYTLFFASFIGGLVLSLAGCLSFGEPASKVDYYTLEYVSPKFTEIKAVNSIIKMERFRVSPVYNSERISYRKNNFQTDKYSNQRWETIPAQLIPYFLFRDIRQSGLFKAVFNHDTGFAATHSISGTVDEFFEDDRGKIWEAVLSLDIILMAENEPDLNKRILFQKRYSARKECAKNNPGALAEAMSKAMSELSAQIITDIYKTLEGKL
ncbi:MAG: ABC-type transport auxiliary lipoprotein family protein [Pseudomonadota bacterium]|nr:membrane integrity-associated transporter subunit PqiC [Pseudomonadota bacterium]MBU1569719.1 membrane integrity-associated transporter subunit PqiC [Pseudomonadota bacterium]